VLVESLHDLFDTTVVFVPDGLFDIPMPDDALELTALRVAVLSPAVVVLAELVLLAVNPLALELVGAVITTIVLVGNVVAVLLVPDLLEEVVLGVGPIIILMPDGGITNHAPEVSVLDVLSAIIHNAIVVAVASHAVSHVAGVVVELHLALALEGWEIIAINHDRG
jgi:hypothetical protein